MAIYRDWGATLRLLCECRRNDRAEWLTDLGTRFDVSEQQVMDWYTRALLVVWDDLGIREATPPQQEVALALINAREGKPTVFTSNLSPIELAKIYDDRFVSRLNAGSEFEMQGADRRVD